MASNSCFLSTMITLALFIGSSGSSAAQLSTEVYSKSCPGLLDAVKSNVQSAISKEARMGASLLRLFFQDCFVNGCDGSILLDDTKTFIGEKNAAPNANSVRGFDVIDQIKSDVEKMCPNVVSCADILALAARDSVVTLGGPNWEVKLGRRDSTTASQAAANTSIPSPTSSLSQLAASFNDVGLSFTDMVALSGAHTIGMARCTSFRYRVYNDTNIDPSFARTRRQNCPKATGEGDDNLAPLDVGPAVFDNSYYKTLVSKRGLLHSDQELFSGGPADLSVVAYAVSKGLFYSDFAKGMIKMGDIKPLTGSMGEIRKNCRRVNV